ncbi:MAG: restriction endonuclease subunit S, partial [Verrucomicrobiota bacterium]
PAQGKERSDAALGHASQNPSSPQGAKELPHGWKHVRLGDIAQTTSGGTPRRDKPQYYGGTIPWVKSGELGDRVVYETSETLSDEGLTSSNAKVFPKGTLCIALYGATVGKLGILGVDAATNQAVCAIFPPEGLDTRYLYRFFEGKRRELIEQGKGGAQSNISQGIIRDTMFPLPPLPEQRRIVAEIEKQFTRLEAGVAALRRVQANLKRYRAAVLKAACEGRLVPTEAALARSPRSTKNGPPAYETGEALLARILTERRQNWQGRGQYKEPATPDTANLPPLPDGWTWASFDQVTTLITKGSSPNWQGFNYCDEGIVFVRSENVRWGTLDLDGVAHLPPAFNDKERKSILREGDVLLNLVGASIGRAAIATAEVDGGNVNQAVAVIRLVAKKTMKQFAMLWLNSTDGQKRIHAEKVDVARANFSLEDTRVLPFPLPPLAEQTRIVAEVKRRLSVVEELESVVTANLQRATRLRQSILQKAFAGNLVC